MNPLDKAARDAAAAMAPTFERCVASLNAAAESMRALRVPAVPSMLNISGFGAPAAQDDQTALIEQLTKLNDKLLAENATLKEQLASTHAIQPVAQFATATAFDEDPLLTEARKQTALLELLVGQGASVSAGFVASGVLRDEILELNKQIASFRSGATERLANQQSGAPF